MFLKLCFALLGYRWKGNKVVDDLGLLVFEVTSSELYGGGIGWDIYNKRGICVNRGPHESEHGARVECMRAVVANFVYDSLPRK